MTISATKPRTEHWWQLQPRAERWALSIGIAVVVLAAIAFPLLNRYWPYRYRNVKPLLETVLASKITIDHYHRIYFPHPGFVASGLTLRRNDAQDLPPIGSAQELRVEGNWGDLLFLHKRVRLLQVSGLHVVIPPPGTRANQQDFPPGSSADFAGPTTPVETLDMQNALLELVRTDGQRSTYPIRHLVMHGVRKGATAQYDLDMQNGSPSGRIQARGHFGPLNPSNLGATAVSGEFVFAPANLGDIGTLHGTVAARGYFSGQLASIEATVSATTPNFAVGDGRPALVSGKAQCTVNALNANVILHTIEVRTGSTLVRAAGSVMGSPKATDLQIEVVKGRAEDLLQPFLHDRVPVTGFVWVRSHAHVAPGSPGETFLQRLTMDGRFEIPAERLTNINAERSLTAFSARAQGAESGRGDPGNPATSAADVISSLNGAATIRNGVVSTDRLTFAIPGANATLNGTYALRTGAAHLTGQLTMQADISHAATGFKSWLLKPLAPFFRKKNAGAVVTIAITGLPHHYKVSQDVLHTK